MDGIEFQIRSHATHPHSQYPLSLDQKIAQGDTFRQAKDRLGLHLQSIEQFYSSPEAGTHTGQPDCNRCVSKKRQINQAYYEYYLSPEPGRWDSGLHQYRDKMYRMLNEPERYSLKDIHRFHQTALRDHLKADLCTPLPTDDSDSYAFKGMISDMFNQGRPTPDILSFYLTAQLNNSPSQEAAEFIARLQDTTTPEERSQIYIKYYCTNNWDDDSTQKNFKKKYARMFSELLSHDTVVSSMRKDAEDAQAEKLRKLREKLADIQMARSAHMKDKKRKAEKADQRMMDRDSEENRIVGCGLPRCRLEVNLAEETIECVVCDWLVRKGSERGRVYYCSVEHAEEDFDEHDRNDHQCCMGNRCYYNPLAGPLGETGAGGVCPDCMEHEFTNYFCSTECFEYNLDYHRDEFHYGRGIHNDADSLERFRPAHDMEIIS